MVARDTGSYSVFIRAHTDALAIELIGDTAAQSSTIVARDTGDKVRPPPILRARALQFDEAR